MRQVVAFWQAKLLGQGFVTIAGQLPAPLQDAASVRSEPEQLWLRHEPVGKVQVAVVDPLQLPPQPLPPSTHAVRPPVGAPVTGLQVATLPLTSQAAHWSVQEVLQQTPSTHSLLVH